MFKELFQVKNFPRSSAQFRGYMCRLFSQTFPVTLVVGVSVGVSAIANLEDTAGGNLLLGGGEITNIFPTITIE
jgi:hypothetical protein